MSFVAVEFDNGVNNTHVVGYLRIPENFHSSWSLGFRCYIADMYNVKGPIEIYPLNVRLTNDTMGSDIAGYTNMEDDFNMALRSNHYYPECADTDFIRRQWSMLDPMSPDYHVKER